MITWLKDHRYHLPLGYAVVYLVWYFALEARGDQARFWVWSPLDDLIPFREEFLIGYLLWFPYWLGTIGWLYWRDRREQAEFGRLAYFMITGITLCLLGYTFFSTGTQLRPPVYPRENILTTLVGLLQGFDTPTNVFPSLHVYTSIVAHYAITATGYLDRYPWRSWVSALAMCLISASTVFLKQHSVLDIFSAAGLFVLLWLFHQFWRGHRNQTSTETQSL